MPYNLHDVREGIYEIDTGSSGAVETIFLLGIICFVVNMIITIFIRDCPSNYNKNAKMQKIRKFTDLIDQQFEASLNKSKKISHHYSRSFTAFDIEHSNVKDDKKEKFYSDNKYNQEKPFELSENPFENSDNINNKLLENNLSMNKNYNEHYDNI